MYCKIRVQHDSDVVPNLGLISNYAFECIFSLTDPKKAFPTLKTRVLPQYPSHSALISSYLLLPLIFSVSHFLRSEKRRWRSDCNTVSIVGVGKLPPNSKLSGNLPLPPFPSLTSASGKPGNCTIESWEALVCGKLNEVVLSSPLWWRMCAGCLAYTRPPIAPSAFRNSAAISAVIESESGANRSCGEGAERADDCLRENIWMRWERERGKRCLVPNHLQLLP